VDINIFFHLTSDITRACWRGKESDFCTYDPKDLLKIVVQNSYTVPYAYSTYPDNNFFVKTASCTEKYQFLTTVCAKQNL